MQDEYEQINFWSGKGKGKGGIKSVYITDGTIPTTVQIQDIGYDPKKVYDLDFKNIDTSKFKSNYTQTITLTIKTDKREIWQKLGYESEEAYYKSMHFHCKTGDGDFCYTCGTELKDCSLINKTNAPDTNI